MEGKAECRAAEAQPHRRVHFATNFLIGAVFQTHFQNRDNATEEVARKASGLHIEQCLEECRAAC